MIINQIADSMSNKRRLIYQKIVEWSKVLISKQLMSKMQNNPLTV